MYFKPTMKYLKLFRWFAVVLVRIIITGQMYSTYLESPPCSFKSFFFIWTLLSWIDVNDWLCVSSKLNIRSYFINYTSSILSTKLKMTTEWMMVFLSREPSEKPVLSKQEVSLPYFHGKACAHTGTVGKGVLGVIKAWGEDTAEGPDYVICPLKPHFRNKADVLKASLSKLGGTTAASGWTVPLIYEEAVWRLLLFTEPLAWRRIYCLCCTWAWKQGSVKYPFKGQRGGRCDL